MTFKKAESQPELSGQIHPDFGDVADMLRSQLAGTPGGAAVCVYHRGRCVVDLWGGERDSHGRPWQRDTVAPSFSTTKGIASTLLHMMVERGLVDYDDRVAEHWPEFAQNGKRAITVRHVMAHQSGLYHIRQMIDRADRMLDWEYMVGAIERAEPAHPPGARTGYHGLTYGFLVGEILRRVTGKEFPELVREELAEPLGLDGLYVGAPEEVLPRAAELIWPSSSAPGPEAEGRDLDGIERTILDHADTVRSLTRAVGFEVDLRSIFDALGPRGISGFDFGSPETLRQPIPSGNGLFTARSLARVYAAWAGGGELDGVRLISRDTLRRASEVQTPAPGLAVLPFDMRWRLGFHGVATSRGMPRHAFGHFGFGGSGAWADPSRELAVGMIVNSGMSTPFGDLRNVRVGGAALAAADRCSGRRHRGVLRWFGTARGGMAAATAH